MMARSGGVVRPEAIRRKVEAWLAAEDDEAVAIALSARPEWSADPVLTVSGTPVRVVPCPTPLAVQAALHDRTDGERLVLLTELDETDLGDGLLAHLSQQQVRSIEPWELVRQMFGGPALDPTLVATGRWVAGALSDYAPPDGWPKPPGTILTRDHALRSLTAELLGVPPSGLDDSGLLQWSTDATAQMRLITLSTAVAEGVAAYLTETAGPVAVPVMAAARAGHGIDLIPLGLLTDVLWPEQPRKRAEVEIAVARARLEPRFGGTPLTAVQARALKQVAEAWVDRAFSSNDDGRHEAQRMLRRAEVIADEIGITDLLGASAVLPHGFVQRLRAFAAAVRVAVPAGGLAVPAQVVKAQNALTAVEEHRAADPHRVETARMAVRLLRWLGTPDDAVPPSTLLDALHRQVRQDGWVDRARMDVFAGDVDEEVGQAYRLLWRAVDSRRTRHDQQFAALLAAATAGEVEPGALLRVEDVLDRIVQPILERGHRVLVLVLDGMSVAAATELAESVTGSGIRVELTPKGGARTGVLAVLPTVTEASRCSLLSGRLSVGGQQAERVAFKARFPDGVLLHKRELRTSAGMALDPEVLAALDDPKVPLVAAVVNTIDDALDRSDPGTVVWGSDTIPAARDLLASTSDRVIVIVSDHGHVVDQGTDALTLPGPGGGNRWRPATGQPATGSAGQSAPAVDGEVMVTGSRVLLGGGSVVLPWRQDVRYGPRKAGYHGGAAPAEAVIPLLVLSPGDEKVLPGWAGAPVASPAWWREPLTEETRADSSSAARRKQRQPIAQSDSLFELPSAAPRVALELSRPDTVDALLASERYAQRRDARTPLSDERVAALLTTLLDGGGRATLETLAVRANIPAHRIGGTITALRRLLQVEGYPVVTLDPDGRTVHLDRDLLVEQFELEKS